MRKRNVIPRTDELTFKNQIFASFSPDTQGHLRELMTTHPMVAGETLYRDGEPVTQIVFPHAGVISLQARMQDGRTVEKNSIGQEGVLGLPQLHGDQLIHGQAIVRIDGYASWIPVQDFENAITRFKDLFPTLMRFIHAFTERAMQAVACASAHSATQRIASWLLHAHDRAGGDTFSLTQQGLSEVLNLRRATVSDSCSYLQSIGALTYSRGTIVILDRSQLKKQACECYDAVRKFHLIPRTN